MPHAPPSTDSPVDRLVAIMATLRSPGGCPWDREQSLATLTPFLIEEAYEVVAAVESGDRGALREELGDVLLQIAFQSQLCAEEGSFTFHDVADTIVEKLIRRHPHVFGESDAADADAVLRQWDALKRDEKGGDEPRHPLGDIPSALPALHRAYEAQRRAARLGMDWPDREGVRARIDEELGELTEAMAGGDADAIEDELGDILFSVVNLARHVSCRPEEALRKATARFASRIEAMAERLQEEGRAFDDCTPDELDEHWRAVKGEG